MAAGDWPLREPRADRRTAGLIRPRLPRELPDRAADGQPVAHAKILQSPKSAGQVQWRRQPGGRREVVNPIVGPDEVQPPVAAEQVGGPGAAAEIGQVRAAAHADVLAVVDEFAGRRIDERAGASAQPASGFEQFDAAAGLGQRHGGSRSGQAAADHGHARRRGRRIGVHGTAARAGSRGERNNSHRVAICIFRQRLKPTRAAQHVAVEPLDLAQQGPIDRDHAAEHPAAVGFEPRFQFGGRFVQPFGAFDLEVHQLAQPARR